MISISHHGFLTCACGSVQAKSENSLEAVMNFRVHGDGFDESLQHQDGKSQKVKAAEDFRQSLKITSQATET